MKQTEKENALHSINETIQRLQRPKCNKDFPERLFNVMMATLSLSSYATPIKNGDYLQMEIGKLCATITEGASVDLITGEDRLFYAERDKLVEILNDLKSMVERG